MKTTTAQILDIAMQVSKLDRKGRAAYPGHAGEGVWGTRSHREAGAKEEA